MAPVEIITAASIIPAATVAFHLVAVAYLTNLVGRTIYRSYLALPPSSSTRSREPLRKGHVKTFSLLALTSIAVAIFYGVSFSRVSYGAWASERGVEMPRRWAALSSFSDSESVKQDSIFGDKGSDRGGVYPGRFEIVKWLSDTPLYQSFAEIVADKARYYWWGQQVTLGVVSWSHFLAIEGQRRNIPYLWAFMALAQLVNLSFAQNLFFITLLLTPVPLPENIEALTRASVPLTSTTYSRLVQHLTPVKQRGWAPKPSIEIVLLLLTYAVVFLTPFASNTPSFTTIISLSRFMPFAPLVLPYIIPESWGTTHPHPHDAYSSYTTLFRTISTIAAGFHIKSTVLALMYNTPDGSYYHPTLLHPFQHEHLSTLERGTTAVGRLFGAIRENPAVGAVGWDVILSGLSVGTWAAIRGLDAREMLGSSFALLKRTEKELKETEAVMSVKEENILQSPTKRRVGRPKKSESITSSVGSSAPVAVRRGRSSKTLADDDADYQPSETSQTQLEGDEDAEEDWEAAALAWGIITAGGLANGSSGVYGAEIMAR